MNTGHVGTEGKSVLQIERELLRRFGNNREYRGCIEDGLYLINFMERVTTAPYEAPQATYATQEVLSLYTKHLYIKPPYKGRVYQQQLLTNYEHALMHPGWLTRVRSIIRDQIADLSGNWHILQSTVHVWNTAVAVVFMIKNVDTTYCLYKRTVRTSVITDDFRWFTSVLYTHSVDTFYGDFQHTFRITGQDVTQPCPIL